MTEAEGNIRTCRRELQATLAKTWLSTAMEAAKCGHTSLPAGHLVDLCIVICKVVCYLQSCTLWNAAICTPLDSCAHAFLAAKEQQTAVFMLSACMLEQFFLCESCINGSRSAGCPSAFNAISLKAYGEWGKTRYALMIRADDLIEASTHLSLLAKLLGC